MHPHRIDADHPCAATHVEPARARVVGLGAPLSVRIRLRPCEVPALRRQILAHMHAPIEL